MKRLVMIAIAFALLSATASADALIAPLLSPHSKLAGWWMFESQYRAPLAGPFDSSAKCASFRHQALIEGIFQSPMELAPTYDPEYGRAVPHYRFPVVRMDEPAQNYYCRWAR